MAKINQDNLEFLNNYDIREFYNCENIYDCKIPIIKDYVLKGKDIYEMTSRINRVERILSIIVVKRFKRNEI